MFFPTTQPLIATPPAVVPDWEQVPSGNDKLLAIDLDVVKDFLNIPLEDDSFDAEKTAMIMVAQRSVEQHCQFTLLQSTWVGALTQFFPHMRINKRPYQSVSKIEYVDATTGEIQTVDPTTYVASKTKQFCGLITLGDGCAWPDAANRPDGVRITVTAGWTQAALPYEIQQALLITTASIDRSRGDGGAGGGNAPRQSIFAMKHPSAFGAPSIIPMEAKALLAPYCLRTVVVA